MERCYALLLFLDQWRIQVPRSLFKGHNQQTQNSNEPTNYVNQKKRKKKITSPARFCYATVRVNSTYFVPSLLLAVCHPFILPCAPPPPLLNDPEGAPVNRVQNVQCFPKRIRLGELSNITYTQYNMLSIRGLWFLRLRLLFCILML